MLAPGREIAPALAAGGTRAFYAAAAATPHPPPSGAPSPQGEGLRVRHSRRGPPQGEGLRGYAIQHREPLKGKANGGVSFNTANSSRGKANGGVPFNTATHQGGRLGLVRPGHPSPCDLIKGKADACGRGTKKDRRGRSFCLLFGCTAYWDLFCSFWSMAVNSGGRGQWSSTGSPVRGWTKRRPAAWRHWPVRPGTGFLAP